MKSVCVLVVVFFLVSSSVLADDSNENTKKRLQLRVIKHQPCNGRASNSERIRFPPIEQAPIQVDLEKGDGCYIISGQVQVVKPLHGVVQIYSETKYGTKTPTEKCRGADSSNCGGVGSCIYCDVCGGIKNITRKTSGLVQLETGTGRQFDCGKGLNTGNYSDVRITFCMPTKADFLKSQNMDEQFWNQYVSDGRLFFITLYMFNEPVNRMASAELQRIATVEGDRVIGCHRMSVMSVAVSEEHDLFYVASSTGLHELVLSTGELVKTIKMQMCLDVWIVDVPLTIMHKDGVFPGGTVLLTAFSLSTNRFGPDQESYICLYPYKGLQDREMWTPVLRMPHRDAWGRIRKLAYSKKQGCLFISTKFDHSRRGVLQNSAVWRVNLVEGGLGKLLIYKEASSMWYMAVDDQRDFLVISERGDDYHHAIDVYDSISGQHLITVAASPSIFPNRMKWASYGFVLWPRGIAVDSLGRVYVVDSGRIQEFDSQTGSFVSMITRFPFNNPKGVVLVEKSHAQRRLYVIGSQSSPKTSDDDPVHKCQLFICDVQDWCPCKECRFQETTPIKRSMSSCF